MIKGIEILNKTPITEMTDKARIVGIIAFIFLIIAFISLIISSETENIKCSVVSAVLLFVFIIISVICKLTTQPTGRYTYKVTIDESVPINEVYENYNVIKQDGKIWILEDKEK